MDQGALAIERFCSWSRGDGGVKRPWNSDRLRAAAADVDLPRPQGRAASVLARRARLPGFSIPGFDGKRRSCSQPSSPNTSRLNRFIANLLGIQKTGTPAPADQTRAARSRRDRRQRLAGAPARFSRVTRSDWKYKRSADARTTPVLFSSRLLCQTCLDNAAKYAAGRYHDTPLRVFRDRDR